MNDINKRIYEVRKNFHLTMENFGEKICLTKSSISSIEKGTNHPSKQTLKLICNEFNVNPTWLQTGIGEMFNIPDISILDHLADEFKLTNKQKLFIKSFLDTPNDEKDVIIDFMLRYISSMINS